MVVRIASMPVVRASLAPTVLVALLVMAAKASDSDLVATLRGRAWFEDEIGQGQTQGYYENLLDNSRKAGPKRTENDALNVPPPQGVVLFRDAGIVDEARTYLRWKLRPNLDARWNGTVFRTNSLGFRTPEVSTKKPAGTYRIVVFGSSNTMGQGVNDDDPYPRHLERWLNWRMGTATGPRIEVVNLSVSGDSPTRRLQRMHEEGERFQADWFLCDATVFDYFLEESHMKAVLAENIAIPFDFVREALERAGISAADSPAELQRKLRGQYEWFLDRTYGAWSSEAKRLGVPMTVVILPRTDHQMSSPRVFQLVRTLCERHGLKYLDFSGAFHGLDEQRLQVSSWDHHPSALGHFAIFEAFRDAVERQGGLPGLPLPAQSH